MGGDQNMGRVNGGGEYSRPRRPNMDTVSYLKSLPIDYHIFTKELERGVDDDDNDESKEAPPTLCAALVAISEIRDEVASLATEENSAIIIETLARIAGPYSDDAVRVLLQGVTGYAVFLSTHRYGSHVLQTLLETCSESPREGTTTFEMPKDMISGGTEEIPTVTELALGILHELIPASSDLSVHICGSHVLRTLLCTLGGVKLIAGKVNQQSAQRGKKKKKKKKFTGQDEGRGRGVDTRIGYVQGRVDYETDAVQDGINQLVAAVTGEEIAEPGYLQQLAVHPSAGPLLGIMLQTLVFRDARNKWEKRIEASETEMLERRMDHHLALVRGGPTVQKDSTAYGLLCRLLCWQPDTKEQEWASDVIYGLAGDIQGSHLFEVLIRMLDAETSGAILECGGFYGEATLKEYIEHDVSNFVVQAIITSIQSEEHAEKFSEALSPFLSSGYVVKASNRRRGILWRLVELASKYPCIQRNTLKIMREGFVAAGGTDSRSNGLVKAVPGLLGIVAPPEESGGRLALDAAGTRTVFHMLRFEPKYCEEALLGLTKLTQEELFFLAKDGLGSRCIWDGMLEGPVRESHFATALKRILKEMAGKFVALACDRVGFHVVQKLFRRLVDMSDREVLVQELSESIHRLTGSNMGRSVIENCAVREYTDMGYSEWSKIIRKRAETEGWLRDMEVSTDTKSKKRRERKRKRGNIGGSDRQSTDVQV